MKHTRHAPDLLLVAAVMALTGIGLLMVFSASTSVAYTHFGDEWYYVRRQWQWFLVGLVAMFVASRINLWRSRRLADVALGTAFVLMLLTFVGRFSFAAYGSARWIVLGPIRLQPSEVVKIALVFWAADRLARKGGKIKSFVNGTLLIVLVTVVFFLLVAIHDLGTAIAMLLTVGIMLFSAGVPWLHLAAMGMAGTAGAGLMVWRAPYRWLRITSFRDPWSDALDSGFQLIQSLYAIGSGGILGRGVGQSLQKHFFLPTPHNDFIFSVMAEEIGFVGGSIVIMLFLIVAWRGMRAALRAPDRFSAMLASGLTAMVVGQAAMNIAVVTGSMPVTGIPLPLVSYGGSSLLIVMASLGLLFNVSAYSRR